MPFNDRLLTGLLLVYLLASLVHFVHNAEFLSDYPNLPAWLTRTGVYLAWCGQTAIGILGYVAYRFAWKLAGLALVGVYAGFGFDGLLHYARAPLEAHSAAMNSTIWFEVAAAAVLLAWVVRMAALRRLPRRLA